LQHEEEPSGVLEDATLRAAFPDVIDWMQLVDQKSYMVEDILHKVDRATMACGLEARVPLLDRRIVEFAWRVPQRMRLDARHGKRLMRRVLSRYLPRALIDRPKRGFSVPLADWLRGDPARMGGRPARTASRGAGRPARGPRCASMLDQFPFGRRQPHADHRVVAAHVPRMATTLWLLNPLHLRRHWLQMR
jgi:hypothetical protein